MSARAERARDIVRVGHFNHFAQLQRLRNVLLLDQVQGDLLQLGQLRRASQFFAVDPMRLMRLQTLVFEGL